MEKITVVGAGMMGTAIAYHLNRQGHRVSLWGTKFDDEVIDTREQKGLGVDIPEDIDTFYFSQAKQAIEGRKIIVLCVKAEGTGEFARYMAPYLEEGMVILNISKGIPNPPHLTLCDLIEDKLPSDLSGKVSIVGMGGAARAIEIVQRVFTEVIFASSDLQAARLCCNVFQAPYFTTSFTHDTVGVELCAAMKNSFAITVGMGEGLQRGDNLKAAFMARSATEMAKIVKAKGGQMETVLGPAGVGDLYVTAQGGRNRTLGKIVGETGSVKKALEKMKGKTIEGYTALKGLHRIAYELENEGKLKVEDDLFLFYNLYGILYGGKSARSIVKNYGG